jgi:thiol-disulfide isomerase/thioredoxin
VKGASSENSGDFEDNDSVDIRWGRFRLGALAGVLCILPTSAPGAAGEPAQGHSRVSDRMRGRELAAELPPLENPEHRSVARATHMRDEDLVLGVVVSGQARAYPWWIVKNYHVVNDTIGGTPVVIAFCEQCSGGAAFRRQHKGRTLSLDVAGVYNGTIILKDRDTGTLWAPFSGRALEGPLAGQKLHRFPLVFTHWDDWSVRHPDTDVVWASPSARGGHGSWYTAGKWGIVSEMGLTIENWDSRLPENTLVYGIENGERAKAYPLSSVRAHQGVVNDAVGSTPIVVVARGITEAAGFERTLKGQVLSFRPSSDPRGVMTDAESGSLWSLEGEAIGGVHRGARLKPLDGYSVEWHVWSAYNPRTDVLEAPASDNGRRTEELVFPDLLLEGLDGKAPRALVFRGDVNLVALWSAWCPPCRRELPLVQDLVRKHAARGLSAVGIAIHIPEAIERAAVRSFVAEAKITFPTLLVDDPAYEQLDSLARSLGGPGLVLPTVFVTNRKGRILAAFRGKEVDALPQAVGKLLSTGP